MTVGDLRKPHVNRENGKMEVYNSGAGGVLQTPSRAATKGLSSMLPQSTPSRHPAHKLSAEQIIEAVTLYDGGASTVTLAARFGVSRQSMWDVLRRRTTMRPKLRYGAENHFYRDGKRAEDHAQNLVEYAIRRGEIVRPGACEACGNAGRYRDGRTAIQAHHDDYTQPLNVRWLCQPCHHKWHKLNTPKRSAIEDASSC